MKQPAISIAAAAAVLSQGMSAATHTVRSGDSAGGGSSVDLSEGGP